MGNPLQVLFGPTPAHMQREAQIAEGAAKTGVTAPPPQAAPPTPATPAPARPAPSFLASAATATPPSQNIGTKTLLGQ